MKTANIAIKLNNGQAYVFGNVAHFTMNERKAYIYPTDGDSAMFELNQVKEVLIKPMPLMESIAKSVLGIHRYD